MDALEMTLLFDYYGELLTQRQRDCLDMRYNQDMSLGPGRFWRQQRNLRSKKWHLKA